MKPTTLELLCCPFCKAGLSPQAESEALLCVACDRSYPVRKGIVHFFDPQELEGSNQHFERYYNRLAPLYSIFTKFAFLPFGGERKARREILDHLVMDGGRTLEVSIGNGVNLPYLFDAPKAGEIFGIDISIGQLSQCQKLTHKRNWQVDLFLAMAEQLPFKDETFDNILHIGGINFFSDKKQAIEEMIRVVRPGGKVVIADEAERLAKRVNRSFDTSLPGQDGAPIETTISSLVPSSMKEIRLDGIWKAHGKNHGYCLEFQKPDEDPSE